MTNRITKPLLSGLALFSLLAAGAAHADVVVTTGAGYIPMVKALSEAYAKEMGGKISTAFGGNIGQMLAQAKEGSGVNVVISDRASLGKFSKLLAADETVLGTTPIVLVWKKGLELKTPTDLKEAAFARIAMPDPKAAVYGRAADDYLKTTGLDKDLGAKVNIVSTVPQVTAYVVKGEMDAGFVNRAAAKNAAGKLGGQLEIFDQHKPIVMTARPVVQVAQKDAADVKAFLSWLTGATAKEILKANGLD